MTEGKRSAAHRRSRKAFMVIHKLHVASLVIPLTRRFNRKGRARSPLIMARERRERVYKLGREKKKSADPFRSFIYNNSYLIALPLLRIGASFRHCLLKALALHRARKYVRVINTKHEKCKRNGSYRGNKKHEMKRDGVVFSEKYSSLFD